MLFISRYVFSFIYVVLLDIAPLLRWRSFRGRRQLPQAGKVCANGPFQVLCLTTFSSIMAFWAVQEDADTAANTDVGDWGR